MTNKAPHQRHNYFSKHVLGDTEGFVNTAREALEGVNFDTFVTIGMSGAMAGAILAPALGKHLYVVRKPEDTTHDSTNGFGVMGNRWVFLDDFVSSGLTYVNLIRRMRELSNDGLFDNMIWRPRARRWDTIKHRSTHVGAYLYSDGQYRTQDDALTFTRWNRNGEKV